MTDLQINNDIDAFLKESLGDAQLLLSYLVKSGLEIDEESTREVAKMRESVEKGTVSLEAEVDFWVAFDHIARKVSPVTVSSLRCSHDVYGVKSLFRFWDRRPVSHAKRAISRFRLLSFIALLFVVIFQIYWSVGVTILRDISEFSENLSQKVDSQNTIMEEVSNQSGVKALSDDSELTKIKTDIQNYSCRLEMSSTMLETWNRIWKLKFLSIHDTSSLPDPNGQNVQKIQVLQLTEQHVAQFTLQALQLYFLPLLYGWLGACTYVLRLLLEEIKCMTYTRESGTMYSLRIFLGALAGLAVGWFFKPEADQIFVNGASPFALAFLAGYSVELLFAGMDRIVAAFSQQPAKG